MDKIHLHKIPWRWLMQLKCFWYVICAVKLLDKLKNNRLSSTFQIAVITFLSFWCHAGRWKWSYLNAKISRITHNWKPIIYLIGHEASMNTLQIWKCILHNWLHHIRQCEVKTLLQFIFDHLIPGLQWSAILYQMKLP